MEPPVDVTLKLMALADLARCGYQRLEITSFSHPKWMPQFADSDSLCRDLFKKKAPANLELMAFVPNETGLERLLKYPIKWVSCFIATSETFNQKNVNASIEQTLEDVSAIVKRAHKGKCKVRVYVSTVFGCPYEGEINDKKLFPLLKGVAKLSPDEIALSDTIGVATPVQVRSVLKKFAKFFPVRATALHLHNTYGMALASAEAGYQLGVRRFDGSTGSIGGCPYAKGATGNVAAEELAYLFYRIGARPSFARDSILKTLATLSGPLGLPVKSRLHDIWSRGGTLYGIH
jgi:hydroxymethylglutaryl-CoA lyase